MEALILAAIAALAAWRRKPSKVYPPPRKPAPFIVVDGDTIKTKDGKTKYRLVGFNAPETFGDVRPEVRKAGRKTAARLRELLETHDVKLIESINKHGAVRTDKYGRKLAVLRLNGHDIAGILIAEGLAEPYSTMKRKRKR